MLKTYLDESNQEFRRVGGWGVEKPWNNAKFQYFSKNLHLISSDTFILRIKLERAESEVVTQKMPRKAHP